MITSLKLVSHLADAILRNVTTKVLKNQSYQFEVKENSSKYILFQCFDHVTVTYVLPLVISDSRKHQPMLLCVDSPPGFAAEICRV